MLLIIERMLLRKFPKLFPEAVDGWGWAVIVAVSTSLTPVGEPVFVTVRKVVPWLFPPPTASVESSVVALPLATVLLTWTTLTAAMLLPPAPKETTTQPYVCNPVGHTETTWPGGLLEPGPVTIGLPVEAGRATLGIETTGGVKVGGLAAESDAMGWVAAFPPPVTVTKIVLVTVTVVVDSAALFTIAVFRGEIEARTVPAWVRLIFMLSGRNW
jgi:hypothetical protein